MGKDKKKHRNKSSKHKKNKPSKSKTPLSSEDSSNSEEEWVEETSNSFISAPQPPNTMEDKNSDNAAKQHDWMMNSALFACTSRDEIRQSKEKKKDKHEDDKYMLDKLGQTDRELNPYWKGGGSGLPAELSTGPESLRQATVTVGDQGAAWLRKALQRAREQAADQGRPLEVVVAERWGSLEKLESMISAAEERDRIKTRHLDRSEDRDRHSSSSNRREQKQCDERKQKYSCKNENSQRNKSSRSDKFSDNFRSSKKHMAKPADSDDDCSKSQSRSRKEKRFFSKPASSDDSSDCERIKTTSKKKGLRKKHSESSRDSSSSSRSSSSEHKLRSQQNNYKNKNSHRAFSKPYNSSSEDDKIKHYDKHKTESERRRESKKCFIRPRHYSEDESSASMNEKRQSVNHRSSYSSSRSGWRKKPENEIKEVKPKFEQLKPEEPKSTSKVIEKTPVKELAKVLTDKEMNELGAKLVKAEILGNQARVDELKEQMKKAREAKASGAQQAEVEAEVVLLTHTDSRGFTRPVSLGGLVEPTGGRRKANKIETHSDGKRMRYFADDDKYSLQEMFQREKLSTVDDSNEVFAKLASKGVGRDDSARDMDDVFEETARVEESDGRRQAKERQQAIEHSKRTARSLDNCQWCLESKQMLKHLIIAIGNKCYLCVPPYQSLAERHCLIVPSHHCPCATQLDEDVWAEMQEFRSSLVKMFLSEDEDVVFFESARYLNKFPHMVLNCVPMPKETGDLAPIYFKKAILECEMEWSNNKKLVELKGRDVRRAVPRGLPYFAIDFGYSSGFAHVIEDEKIFPQNFAQEIIGGMLDLDHTIWRKQRKQTFEEQSKKVIQLAKSWAPFDCTKKYMAIQE